jgi:hypothetical protein
MFRKLGSSLTRRSVDAFLPHAAIPNAPLRTLGIRGQARAARTLKLSREGERFTGAFMLGRWCKSTDERDISQN